MAFVLCLEWPHGFFSLSGVALLLLSLFGVASRLLFIV